jgi:hypothetical protein
MSKKDKVHYVRDIKDIGPPTDELSYFSGHFEASINEIERHGVKRFDRLTQEINKDIPFGELAGTHHRDIEVSSRIPRHPMWMRKEIREHEEDEKYYMGD